MIHKNLLLAVVLFLAVPLCDAQQPAISANAGLGPGNSFTLFVTFENPVPKIQNLNCAFQHQGTPKPGQEDFVAQLRCSGPLMKDDDKHYRMKVGDIPEDIMAGDYKIVWITVAVDGQATHTYQGSQLPDLAPVAVDNPKHLEFSPIKKLEIK